MTANEQKREIEKVPEHRQCQWGCGTEGFPVVFMGAAALYCGDCMEKEFSIDEEDPYIFPGEG